MKIVRFAAVGSVGFLVDAVTMLSLSFYITAIPARGIAFWMAASVNWWLNRHITFDAGDAPHAIRQWGRFIGVSCLGFIPNWGCYWLLMSATNINQLYQRVLNHYPDLSVFGIHHNTLAMIWPFVAMVPGVLLGLLSNYLLAERWVFR